MWVADDKGVHWFITFDGNGRANLYVLFNGKYQKLYSGWKKEQFLADPRFKDGVSDDWFDDNGNWNVDELTINVHDVSRLSLLSAKREDLLNLGAGKTKFFKKKSFFEIRAFFWVV